MMNHLHQIALRIATVKAARAVAVRARRLNYRYIVSNEKLKPYIDIIRGAQDESDMIQALTSIGYVLRPVQRDIIATRRQIQVVWVWPPLDLKAQQIYIKPLAGRHICHIQRHMAQAARGRWPFHLDSSITLSSSRTSCLYDLIVVRNFRRLG